MGACLLGLSKERKKKLKSVKKKKKKKEIKNQILRLTELLCGRLSLVGRVCDDEPLCVHSILLHQCLALVLMEVEETHLLRAQHLDKEHTRSITHKIKNKET